MDVDNDILDQNEDFQGTEPTPEASEFDQFLSIIADDDDAPADNSESEDDPTEAPEDPEEAEEDNDEDAEEEEEVNEEDSDEDEDDDETPEDEDIDEDVENDPVEVDFDTVITLPNGEEVSIEELSNGYKNGEALREAQESFEQEKHTFEENSKDLSTKLDLAKLEAQRVLDDFEGFDWQKLAQEDPQEFANTKLFVEKYATRKSEIEKAQTQLEEQRENEKKSELESRAKDCVKILERDLPEWNQDLYQKVINHAVQLGMSQDSALNLTDAGVIKALVNSMKMEQGKRVVKAKITKKVKAPTKVVKPGAKKAKAVKASANYRNEAEEFKFFSKFL